MADANHTCSMTGPHFCRNCSLLSLLPSSKILGVREPCAMISGAWHFLPMYAAVGPSLEL